MEQALNKFLENWTNNPNVIAILLTGSYAIEMNHENSDVDIRIILDKNCQTEKGLIEIDGYKFSYLTRSYDNIENRIKREFAINCKFEANVIRIGKILFQKSNIIHDLKRTADYYHESNFITRTIADDDLKTNMYHLYNYKSYLETLDEESPFFIYSYISFMKLALNFYSRFLNIELFTDLKVEKLLTNKLYREKSGWSEFPDKEFSNLWQNALALKNINKSNLNEIFNHLQKKIIRFNEKNYKMIRQG